MRRPYTYHRPTRAGGGAGGDGTFTVTLGTALTLYGIVDAHDTETRILISRHADVKTEDIIIIDTGQYRVTNFKEVSHAPFRFALLERMKRPIAPN